MCWLYSLGQMDLSLLICSMEIKLSILERGYDLAQLLVIIHTFSWGTGPKWCFTYMWPGILGWHFWLSAGKEVQKIPLACCEYLPLCECVKGAWQENGEKGLLWMAGELLRLVLRVINQSPWLFWTLYTLGAHSRVRLSPCTLNFQLGWGDKINSTTGNNAPQNIITC